MNRELIIETDKEVAFGIYKTDSGYFKREDLDNMLSGAASPIAINARSLKV